MVVGWRRMDAWEASRQFFVILGLAMLASVAWDWVAREEIRYDRAFGFSLAFAAAFAACSMIFKIRPVFRK
jgi:hypothetical protein